MLRRPGPHRRTGCRPVWCRGVNEALAARGLDFLSSYVWGRAAALGDPSGPVAAAAFAWFEPGMVGALVDAGRADLPAAEVLRIRDRESAASLRAALAGESVLPVADRLLEVAAGLDAHGRVLFAGLRARPLPQDAFGRLQRGCESTGATATPPSWSRPA